MSTRGWYEYYVLDPATKTRSLSMQFYKWGDATPENALLEWQFLKGHIDRADGLLPVVWLDDLLREQLGASYGGLPCHFSMAAFLFLIQRAAEESARYRYWKYRELPEEQRPDYRLGLELGEAMVLNGFSPRHHKDKHLDRVLGFIGTGHFVRPWKEYALSWSVLEWLQYLTQITLETDMGSIAGDYRKPYRDVNYVYRLFIWAAPDRLFGIDRLAIQLCDRDGNDLLTAVEESSSGPSDDRSEYARQEAAQLRRRIAELDADMFSLSQADEDYSPAPDWFWNRARHERPPLAEALGM